LSCCGPGIEAAGRHVKRDLDLLARHTPFDVVQLDA
jgi:hypothetical protein